MRLGKAVLVCYGEERRVGDSQVKAVGDRDGPLGGVQVSQGGFGWVCCGALRQVIAVG